jgi:hypothetical protein
MVLTDGKLFYIIVTKDLGESLHESSILNQSYSEISLFSLSKGGFCYSILGVSEWELEMRPFSHREWSVSLRDTSTSEMYTDTILSNPFIASSNKVLALRYCPIIHIFNRFILSRLRFNIFYRPSSLLMDSLYLMATLRLETEGKTLKK